MTATRDIESIVNTAMMELDRVYRKNGITTGHANYAQRRSLLKGIIAMDVAEQNELDKSVDTNTDSA